MQLIQSSQSEENMKDKINQFVVLLKAALGLFLSISFGLFLFVLFFEPFPLDRFDFNNSIVFVAGIAAITFIIMGLVRITLPWLIQKYDQHQFDPLLPPYANSLLIFILSLVSLSFYIRYIGAVNLSIAVLFKIGIISMFPPISLWLHDLIKDLKKQRTALQEEVEMCRGKVEKYEENYLSKEIELSSDSKSEVLNLPISDVAFFKSADNYVEVVYKEGEDLKSKLLRNTLKSIELQLKHYPNFIRCHRICIVNTHYIRKLSKDQNSHWLSISGYKENIPVSRQHLLKVREAINPS